MIGHHGDCATNAMRKMMADDAVGRSNRLTLLRRCLLMVVVGRRIKSTWASAAGQCNRKWRHNKGDSVVNESCGGNSSEVDANRMINYGEIAM